MTLDDERWSLTEVLAVLSPLSLYYLITLMIYGYHCYVYPVYFAPHSPLLTVCASVLGFAIYAIGFLRRHFVGWFPCIAVYWIIYIGIIGWQLLVTARAYRLYCAIRRHACLVEVAPWQINNTGYLDAAWIKQHQGKRAGRRFSLAMGATMLLAVVVMLAVQLVAQQQPRGTFLDDMAYNNNNNNNNDGENPIVQHVLCPALPWSIYPFFAIWGLIIAYSVPAGIYHLRKYPDHFGVRVELAAISIVSLCTFLGYLVWCSVKMRLSLIWSCALFTITHTISTFMPIYEGWQRRRLAERVTNVRFEEALNEDNDVWRAFFRYAARDFCAENVCFIEQYRRLIHRTEAQLAMEAGDDNTDTASQPSVSTDRPVHCRRSSSMHLPSSSYAKRFCHRLRQLSRDGGSGRLDYAETGELVAAVGPTGRSRYRRPSASEATVHDMTAVMKLSTTTPADSPTSVAPASASPSLHHPAIELRPQRPYSRSLPAPIHEGGSPRPFTAIDVADIDQKATPLSSHPNAKVPLSLVAAYRALFETFIVEGAPLQLNITHATRVAATHRVRSYAYTIGMYAEVYAEIKWSLWVNTFPKFLTAYERDLVAADDTATIGG